MWGETGRRLGGGRRRRGLLALPILGLIVAAAPSGVGHAQPSTSGRALPQAASPAGANAANCPGGVLIPHAPIVINVDADYTAANGVTSGTGTLADPFVISCWSITLSVSSSETGIQVGSAALDKSLTVHDVLINGPGGSSLLDKGISIFGTSSSTPIGDITIRNSTITNIYGDGIDTGNLAGHLLIRSNEFDNIGLNQNFGSVFFDGTDANVVVDSNVATGVRFTCMGDFNGLAAGSLLSVLNNTCLAGPGASDGMSFLGQQGDSIDISGNDVEGGFTRVGLAVSWAHVHGNTVRGNLGNGVFSNSNDVIEANTIENNGAAGIEISSSLNSIIRNNTIINNGSAGIVAQNAQFSFGPHSVSNLIDGNHVGFSPFGIVFAFDPTNNTVENTDWVDGHPSFIRFSNSTTVVDAGSAQRGLVNQPTTFHDWIAQVQAGSIAPSSCTVAMGCAGTTTIASVTGGTYDFGDGSVHTFTTPADLINVATLLQHTYTAAGAYTATLTVNAVDTLGAALNLTDTTPVTIAATSPSTTLVPPVDTAHWSELGNGPDRTFFQGTTGITKSNVATLHTKWRFPTVYPVFASPAIGDVNVGGSLKRMVFDGTYDGNVYGLDDATGLPIWGPVCIVTSSTVSTSEASCNPSFPGNTNAQVDYGTIVASPAVATIGGSQRVFIAANGTLDALDAATGALLWSFVGNATGAQFPQQTSCRQISGVCEDTTYEMESSPVVVGNVVYIGIDCNGECLKGGGIYALDATDGHMLWFFDPAAGSAFVPTLTSTPPSPVMAYNPKMNGPASGSTCGGVWTSPTIDVALGLLYASTANCQVNPLPPYMEAVFALHTSNGSPAWQNQPRPIDALDMDFGATPNVFHLGTEDVVGAASKDGTYTLYDAALGTVKWSTKAALGGAFGGFYNSVTDGTKIYLSSAIGNVDGFSVTPAEENQRGRQYALDARTGNVMWRQLAGPFNIGQNSAVPGIYLTGGLDHLLHAWDADTGAPLAAFPLAGAASGTPVVAANEVYIGAGTGATYRSFVGPSDPLGLTGIQFPHPIPIGEYGQGIYAFCLAQDVTCPATTPTPTVPEAPRAALMPLLGGGILVLAFAAPTLWRRRQARAAR